MIAAMERAFHRSFGDVMLRTDPDEAARVEALGVRAFTDGRTITFARGVFAPDTEPGRRTIAHEFAHVAQLRGGSVDAGLPPLTTRELAEWQADRAAQAVLSGELPRLSSFSGTEPLYDGGRTSAAPRIVTSNDQEALLVTLKSLDTLPNGEQRSGAITFLVALAMKSGPAQKLATTRLIGLLAGIPTKNIGDHMAAIADLREWTSDVRAYDLLLWGRWWFADHSQKEIGSGLTVDAFRRWLHIHHGSYTVEFLRKKIAGDDTIVANLAARVTVDLLELEGTPGEEKYRASYAALRTMARANGLESYGALGAASATPRIFDALAAIREEAQTLRRMLRLGPIGDEYEDQDVLLLETWMHNLSEMGILRDTSSSRLIFTAENREEVEHELLKSSPDATGEWLQEMAHTLTIAVDAGARLEDRTQVLQDGARALDKILGDPAGDTAERKALFDLRHEYMTVWLSALTETFQAGGVAIARGYQSRLDAVEYKFEHFDQAVAQRKFSMAHDRFFEYSDYWAKGNGAYPGNDKLDETFFFAMRRRLQQEHDLLTARFTTTWGGQTPIGIVRMDDPLRQHLPTDLPTVSALATDTSLFGFQSALFLDYATNLSVHNAMLKSGVGSKSFREEQGNRLSDIRKEMQDFWTKGNYEAFLKKSEEYHKTLRDVIEKIKDRAKLDFLLNLGIMLIAALVTEGAALAVDIAELSETLAIARTARAISSFSTLFEVGVFTTTQLTLEKAAFGKDITPGEAIKAAASNLAFAGALKGVGKLAEPLAQGSVVRQLIFGHLIGFSGVAAMSALTTRIETGEWPRDTAAFLEQTAVTYLLIAGMHQAFHELVAKPSLSKVASARLENLSIANQALADTLRSHVESGSLSMTEFESMKAERLRLIEEARAVGQTLLDAGVISKGEMDAINKMANNAVADATGASFPLAAVGTPDPVVLALPAPESVIELTQVGDSNVYVYDPAKPRTKIDTMLSKYTDKGYKVEGSRALRRIVDPMGRTRFVLSESPVSRPRLLPEGRSAGAVGTESPLARATGKTEATLAPVRDALARINRDMESKLAAEYPDYTVLATLAMMVDNASIITPGWSIDALRGVADALSLERGIPNSAVRRLFLAVDPKRLSSVFADFHDVVHSTKVSSASKYVVADDLLPKNSLKLIDALRTMQKAGIELPADMDRRAVRGLARQIERLPDTWLTWLSRLPKAKRASTLRSLSGLTDPTVRLPENVGELLESIGADIPGYDGLNPLAGDDADAFVKMLESRSGAGKFADPTIRGLYVAEVGNLRQQVSFLQQGLPLEHGKWEGVVGLANEVRVMARLLLGGSTILGMDRYAGGKMLPSVNPANFALPGGGKVLNAPADLEVHLDVLFTDPTSKLVAMETTTAELSLPAAWNSLDPKSPSYGADIDWNAVDKDNASHRKFMQAVKIYELNKMATALGTSWSGQKVDPASIRFQAGDFAVPAARALENMGFKLELADGSPQTAASIEARKKPGAKKP